MPRPKLKPPTLKKDGKKVPRLGRPVEGATATGRSRLRFDVPDEVAAAIRERHALAFTESGIELSPFLARAVCRALEIAPPVPKKRGGPRS